MIGCMFTAHLDEKLSAEEKNNVLDQIKKTKGVFSAAFAKAAKPGNVVSVHAGMGTVADEIRKIPGVKKTVADTHKRM